jgi:hypothetical protein
LASARHDDSRGKFRTAGRAIGDVVRETDFVKAGHVGSVTSIPEKLPIADKRLSSFLLSNLYLRRRARPVSGSSSESGRRREGSVPTAVDPQQPLRRPLQSARSSLSMGQLVLPAAQCESSSTNAVSRRLRINGDG